MKAKAMTWLLTWFMIAQSTLISYHTEAFVKTEVACTVEVNQIVGYYISNWSIKKWLSAICFNIGVLKKSFGA